MDDKNFLVYICAEDGTGTSNFERLLHGRGLETKTIYFDARTGLIKVVEGTKYINSKTDLIRLAEGSKKQDSEEDLLFDEDYSKETDNIVKCKVYVEFVPQDGHPIMMQQVHMARRLWNEQMMAIAIGDFQYGRGHAVYFQKGVNRFEVGDSSATRERALTAVVGCIVTYYNQLKKSKDVDKEKD